MFQTILEGLYQLASIQVIALMFMGSFVGLIFGFLPGLGGTIGIAIFIPFLFGMPFNLSLAFLLSLRASVMFGGSISAILFNVPGTSQNIATCFDGYPMSQKGEAAKAIGIAGISSMIGGLFGAFVLAILLPIIRPLIISFGPPEFFMLTLFGLSMIALLTEGTIIKGLISACLGFMVSFVGLDYITGSARFTFGQLYLWDGINFIPVTIGLFAITEMIELYVKGGSIAKQVNDIKQKTAFDGICTAISKIGLILRGSIIGVLIGIIPGIGGSVANILAYGHAMHTTKEPDTFGRGNSEGIICPEAANNAKEGGALIPTLAFGIPGSEGMAILLGVLIMLGLVPGPEMLQEHLDIVFMIVFVLIIGNIFATSIGLLFANKLQGITTINAKQLIPAVLIICLVGSYIINRRFSDVFISIIFAIIGYFMKKFQYSRAAFTIALVLGVMFERYYHISVRLYGHLFIFIRPISLILFLLTTISLIIPFVKIKRSKDNEVNF
jgi:putative tricarboxylic transport membrane protein